MNKEKVIELMISQHALTESMYYFLQDEITGGAMDKEKAKKAIEELKLELKKHYFLEETIIFPAVQVQNNDLEPTINGLKAEHNFVMEKMEEFEENPLKADKKTVESMYNLLMSHRAIEENKVYPAFEKTLGAEVSLDYQMGQ
jgi:iron-sulfur cluster repair protein YtfE (RIC family)